jgi:hypothetical protein
MQVNFTLPQWRCVEYVAAYDQEIYDEIVGNSIDLLKCKRGRIACDSPYVAWKELRDRLYDITFGPRGGLLKRRHHAEGNFSSMRRIEFELKYVDTHPALHGEAMFGMHMDLFPVWKMAPTPVRRSQYTSYPQPGREFVILTPVHQMKNTTQVEMTWWVERSPGEGRLMDEALHTRLRRRNLR